MKASIVGLIFFIALVYCDTCSNKEGETSDLLTGTLIPVLKILFAYPAGLGAPQSFGISVVTYLIDKVFPENKPDYLAETVRQLQQEIQDTVEEATVSQFKGFAMNGKRKLERYVTVHNKWVENGSLHNGQTMRNYFINEIDDIATEINYIIGNDKYKYVGLPMFVVLATSHLSIIRDAAIIGNNYLGLNKNGQLADGNYTDKFIKTLNQYTKELTTTYTNKHNEFYSAKDYNHGHNSLNKYLSFETATTLNAWDIAAQWSMLIPNDNGIPVDIFYTRPVYSKATICDVSNECNVGPWAVNRDRNNSPQYRGIAKKIQYKSYTHDGRGSAKGNVGPVGFIGFTHYYDDQTTFTTSHSHYWSIDGETKIIDATQNITVNYAGVKPKDFHDGYFAYPVFATKAKCRKSYCTKYAAEFDIGTTSIGGGIRCDHTKQLVETPQNHGLSRFIPAQDRNDNLKHPQIESWVFEYRKYNQRSDFTNINTDHAIRFPGEYLFDQNKADLGEIQHMIGGRSINIKTSVMFTMPSQNKGFTYNLRIYALNASPDIAGCIFKKRAIQFGGFDIYDGNCQNIANMIEIKGPMHLGAIEVIQVKEKTKELQRQRFGGTCENDSNCYNGLKCLKYTDTTGKGGKMCAKFWVYTDQCAQTGKSVNRGARDVRNFVFGDGIKKTTNCGVTGITKNLPENCCSGSASVIVNKNLCELKCK
jgi:hypothetical protein